MISTGAKGSHVPSRALAGCSSPALPVSFIFRGGAGNRDRSAQRDQRRRITPAATNADEEMSEPAIEDQERTPIGRMSVPRVLHQLPLRAL